MTDLISRDDAMTLPPYDSDGEPSGMFDHKIFVELDALRALPATDPAAIREAALREAISVVGRYNVNRGSGSATARAIISGIEALIAKGAADARA